MVTIPAFGLSLSYYSAVVRMALVTLLAVTVAVTTAQIIVAGLSFLFFFSAVAMVLAAVEIVTASAKM